LLVVLWALLQASLGFGDGWWEFGDATHWQFGAWYCVVLSEDEELQVRTEVLAFIHLHVTIRQKSGSQTAAGHTSLLRVMSTLARAADNTSSRAWWKKRASISIIECRPLPRVASVSESVHICSLGPSHDVVRVVVSV
jgi:hypothetical protein